jgi:hypothetical protein
VSAEQSQEEASRERVNEPSQPSPKPRTGAEGDPVPKDPGDIPNPTSQPSPDDPGGDAMQRGERERERAARTRRPQP